ncbi:MAG: M1 family metallopeptidase [Pirellulaceae bacterium]|nr:M1 family metallopeptidase [Pirellulaceae bacterium]
MRRLVTAVEVLFLIIGCTGISLAQDAQGLSSEDAQALRARRLGTRSDRTIFSPLELPPPNRLRTAAGLPGPDYWQQQVDYSMDVKLDTENEVVHATAIVTYTNNSPETLEFLWLSLEQNLFREDSLGALTTPPGSRFNNRQRFQGGYDIHHVKVGDSEVPLKVYDTLGRLDLPEPLPGNGSKIEFEISWSFAIPEYGVDRLGIRRVRAGTIFQLAQWFPHVCKYDDVHGWNTLPYLGQGEFYTDFGTYDVKISVPRGHVVCATGELVNSQDVLTKEQLTQLAFAKSSPRTVTIRSEEDLGTPAAILEGEGPATWHFHADQVRSFAWTSSDATIWDAASITWEDGSTVLVQSVYPREARGAWRESTQMLRQSVLHYSEKWFRYPYPTATNVNGNVGGMEYPMIIFCGGDRDRRGLHGVTTHEIGHNWFPMVVNSDERRHAWMDEGFNTFINDYDRIEDFDTIVNGADPAPEMRPISLRGFSRMNSNPDMQPIALPADQIRPEMLGQLAYFKPGMGMRFLRERLAGPDRFDPAFKQYIRAWAFKSPQPADFFRCMENGMGMELAWYWRGWFLENLSLDQAVVSIEQGGRSGDALIKLANLGEMVMPVYLRVVFDDDSQVDIELPVQVWNYTNLWTTSVPVGERKIHKVTIDEDRILPDASRGNNIWQIEISGNGAVESDTND